MTAAELFKYAAVTFFTTAATLTVGGILMNKAKSTNGSFYFNLFENLADSYRTMIE